MSKIIKLLEKVSTKIKEYQESHGEPPISAGQVIEMSELCYILLALNALEGGRTIDMVNKEIQRRILKEVIDN